MLVSDLSEGKALNAKSKVDRGVFAGSALTHCDVKQFWFAFQRDAAKVSIPLRVVWGYRTLEEQRVLHQRGVGTSPGNSAHNKGMAVDVIHMRRAWEMMPRDGWELLGAIGKEAARKTNIPMEWGGDFKSRWDPAHWQIKGWRSQEPLLCGVCYGDCLEPIAMPDIEPTEHRLWAKWKRRFNHLF